MSRRTLRAAVTLLMILAIAWLVLAPPRWWLNATKRVDLTDPVAAGAALVDHYECRRCHQIDGRGSLKAADLAGATQRLDRVALRLWLLDPKAIDGKTAMPNFRLSDDEIDALVAYLGHLDRNP